MTSWVETFNAAVGTDRLDLGSTTSFEPRAAALDFTVVKDHSVPADVVGYIEINVWGTMRFKDRSDSAAVVNVRRSPNGRETHSTRSSAWDGTSHRDLPEGARRRVADAVRALLPETIDWAGVAVEAQRTEIARQIERHMATARREAEAAAALTEKPILPITASTL